MLTTSKRNKDIGLSWQNENEIPFSQKSTHRRRTQGNRKLAKKKETTSAASLSHPGGGGGRDTRREHTLGRVPGGKTQIPVSCWVTKNLAKDGWEREGEKGLGA